MPASASGFHASSTASPTSIEITTALPSPLCQYSPNSIAGKKHAAYRLPENVVSATIPPGGCNASSVVMKANTATYTAVANMVVRSLATGLTSATRSRWNVAAITSSTLSIDDIAAATSATSRKALTTGWKNAGLVNSVGTI